MSFKTESISVYERTTKKRREVTLSIPTEKRDTRKSQTSTCANLIQKKDAYIAFQVVESLLSQRAPIYTVHDNFLTTPPYARIVPDIYTKVFIDMGHPLRIINDLIIMNLILPYNPSTDIHLNYRDPIPYANLQDFLNNISPNIEKKKWQKKISDFMICYQNYVDAVCGNQVIDPEEKWNKFRQLLENRSHNYSVHY